MSAIKLQEVYLDPIRSDEMFKVIRDDHREIYKRLEEIMEAVTRLQKHVGMCDQCPKEGSTK